MSNTEVKQVNEQTPVAREARDERALLPLVDVVEDATGITLYADLPGVSRDRLNLRVEGDTLTIEGDLALAVPQEMRASHAEVQHNRYRRSFTLSKELDAGKVGAELSQGVLRVRIPKAEHAQPRRIEVKAA
jgi:HSP20 family molecular chaperone IbpA